MTTALSSLEQSRLYNFWVVLSPNSNSFYFDFNDYFDQTKFEQLWLKFRRLIRTIYSASSSEKSEKWKLSFLCRPRRVWPEDLTRKNKNISKRKNAKAKRKKQNAKVDKLSDELITFSQTNKKQICKWKNICNICQSKEK